MSPPLKDDLPHEVRVDLLDEKLERMAGYVSERGSLEQQFREHARDAIDVGAPSFDALHQDLIERNSGLVEQLPAERIRAIAEQAWQKRSNGEAPDTNTKGWIPASEIAPENVEWLWINRFLSGRINLLAGMGDVGKDVLCCTVAAIRSTGCNWPDGSPCEKGKVGYITAEDDPEDTLVPRLIAAGADLENIVIWRLDNPPAPDDLDGLSLLIVSPLIEILPDGDANNDRDARLMIKPWKRKAREIGCTIIAIVHYNKKNDLAAVQRILGSVGLPNALRNTWCVERDDEDKTLRLFMRLKGNLLPDEVNGLAFRIQHIGPWSQSIVCAWQQSAITKTVDEVIQAKVRSGWKTSANDWLVSFLRGRGDVRREEIMKAAKEANYTEDAIRQAKSRNPQIIDFHLGFPSKAWWRLDAG
jgi:RecA-family ATPase